MTDETSEHEPTNAEKYARGQQIRVDLWGEEYASKGLSSHIRRFAPEMEELVIREGFGGLYADQRLSLRERSLLTMSSLVTQGRFRQLESHMRAALGLGVTTQEISAALQHLILYVGVPHVSEGFRVLGTVVDELESGS
jgi:4-carboxymuconolactone decarboxylase